ncbi:MAG TPA: hypothetical protein VGF30_04140 [Bacteroidia bacterium]
MNVSELFHKTVDMLRGHTEVTLDQSILNDPVSSSVIAKAELLMGMPLSDDIRDFYLQANGFTIKWLLEKSNSSSFLSGWIDVWPLEKMIGGEYADQGLEDIEIEKAFEEILILDNDSEEERAELCKHRVLESYNGLSSYTTLRFSKYDGVSLHYTDSYRPLEISTIPLSFSEYIKFVFESLGADGCRQALKEKDFFVNPYEFYPELKAIKNEFPATDLHRISAFGK